MTKKQAYDLINYLLVEARDNIEIADFTDIKGVANLLGTADYIRKSYQLKENDEIMVKIHDIRAKAYEHLNMCEKALENIFV